MTTENNENDSGTSINNLNNSEENQLTISYETLFEILRREKYRLDVQKIPKSFYEDMVGFIEEKRKEVSEIEHKVDLHNIAERSRRQQQYDNVIKILSELYDRREKKIINMAINKARTGSNVVDTTNLLPIENRIFEQLVLDLQGFRQRILVNIMKGSVPEVLEKQREDTIKDSEPQKNEKASEMEESDLVTIRFLQAVPKFVGEELETYGPFLEEDVANLPEQIAKLLISKGRAEKIAVQ